jgi:hypothetical protein
VTSNDTSAAPPLSYTRRNWRPQTGNKQGSIVSPSPPSHNLERLFRLVQFVAATAAAGNPLPLSTLDYKMTRPTATGSPQSSHQQFHGNVARLAIFRSVIFHKCQDGNKQQPGSVTCSRDCSSNKHRYCMRID